MAHCWRRGAEEVYPDNVADTHFSVFYQTTAPWLYGDAQGWVIYGSIRDNAVQDLCGKITMKSTVQDTANDVVTTMRVEF
jgi:2-methylcitrate dehydratase PrpD